MGAKVSIRPSALGTKGLLLFCAMELAFLATNYSNLFFMVLAFSAVVGVLGIWWSIRNLRGLRIDDVTVGMAAADTSRAVQVLVDGGTRPRFDLTFEAPLLGGSKPIGYAPLVRGHAAVAGAMPGQQRSLQTLGHLQVRSRFPFGFFVATGVVMKTVNLSGDFFEPILTTTRICKSKLRVQGLDAASQAMRFTPIIGQHHLVR